jgi:hypothetical protein
MDVCAEMIPVRIVDVDGRSLTRQASYQLLTYVIWISDFECCKSGPSLF